MYRKLSHPEQRSTDIFKLLAESDGVTRLNKGLADQQFQVNVEYPLTSINYVDEETGTTKAVAITGATNLATVKTQVAAALASIGYIDPEIGHENMEYRKGLTVEAVDGSNCTLTIIGDCRLVSIVDNSGTVNLTMTDTLLHLVTRTYSGVATNAGTINLYKVNDYANAEAVTVPTTGGSATLKTNLETALTNLGVTNFTVTVTEPSDYLIVIKAPNGVHELLIEGETIASYTSQSEYV